MMWIYHHGDCRLQLHLTPMNSTHAHIPQWNVFQTGKQFHDPILMCVNKAVQVKNKKKLNTQTVTANYLQKSILKLSCFYFSCQSFYLACLGLEGGLARQRCNYYLQWETLRAYSVQFIKLWALRKKTWYLEQQDGEKHIFHNCKRLDNNSQLWSMWPLFY